MRAFCYLQMRFATLTVLALIKLSCFGLNVLTSIVLSSDLFTFNHCKGMPILLVGMSAYRHKCAISLLLVTGDC